MTKITKFPEDLDTNTELPDIDSDDLMDDVGIEHDVQHTLLNQAVIELQKKVGKNNSEDKNSLTGMLEYLFQYEITGSATFSKLTNEIEIEGIKSLKLDVGDVIEISGSNNNDNLYTVEDITDILDNKIIVNYEHRNGNGSLSLIDENINCTIKRICKYWQAPMGLGQAWVDVTSTRGTHVVLNYNQNRAISLEVSIYRDNSGSAGVWYVEKDGFISDLRMAITNNGNTDLSVVYNTVLPLKTKTFLLISASSARNFVRSWWELR